MSQINAELIPSLIIEVNVIASGPPGGKGEKGDKGDKGDVTMVVATDDGEGNVEILNVLEIQSIEETTY